MQSKIPSTLPAYTIKRALKGELDVTGKKKINFFLSKLLEHI